MKNVYILSGTRTPIGSFMGQLSNFSAPQLGAHAIKSLWQKKSIPKEKIEQVVMGLVVQAGVGQAPARQAAIFAELPESTVCSTINKVCGSGMQSIIFASQSIQLGDNSLVVAGGMESMSMAPHFIPTSRSGIKFGEGVLKDAILHDGLWDVYSNRAMGLCAEECVQKYQFSRQEQDEFARESYQRAILATQQGHFKDEISPIAIQNKKNVTMVETDEEPTKVNFEKMPTLKPAFTANGTITAANASSLNDGAAAILLGDASYRSEAEFEIIATSAYAQNPTWFTTAPVMAMKKCLEKAKLNLNDIDVFEINEAFSVVTMAAMKELGLSHQQVNIFGGAVALGHPIGCSGARIVVTLMNAMKYKKATYGMASICIGGGEALSMIIKRM